MLEHHPGAAALAILQRRRSSVAGGAAREGASTMLHFYTDDATGHKMSPITVLLISVRFLAVVALIACGW